MRPSPVAVTLALLCVSGTALAGGWRGDGSGTVTAATPPTRWSPASNVIWKTPLPSWSNASPTLAPDRLFVASEPDTLVCVARKDGRILWTASCPGQDTLAGADRTRWDAAAADRAERNRIGHELRKTRELLKKSPADAGLQANADGLERQLTDVRGRLAGVAEIPMAGGHEQTGATTATPVVDTDSSRVFVFYGSGVVAAFDFDGRRQWIRALKLGASSWGHTATPLLTAGRLMVCHGAVTALNPLTGDTLWSSPSQVRYGSPLAADVAGRACVVTSAGACLDTSDGTVRATGLPDLPYNALVVRGSRVCGMGVGDMMAVAVDLPPSAGGAVAAVWQTPVKKGRYFASPVLSGDLLFGVRQSGEVIALDAVSGQPCGQVQFEPLYRKGGQCYASPLLAGGRLYVCSDNGFTVVIEPTTGLTAVATNELERTRASPVAEGDRLYIRGLQHLYCLGEG